MRAVVLVVTSAFICWLSFPNFIFSGGAPLLAWGCAFPLFYALKARGLRRRFVYALVWGVLAYGALSGWLIPVSPGGWAMFVLALSLQAVVFALLFPPEGMGAWCACVHIPCAWIISEWARTLLLGGFAWSLGYSQALMPSMIQAAAWGGVYAVAWAIIFVNAVIFVHGIRGLVPAIMGVLAVAGLGIVWLAIHPAGAAVTRVAAIQPNMAFGDKVREDLYDVNVTRHMELAKQVVRSGRLGPADLVVWPETAITDDVITDLKWRPRLETAARNLDVNMLIGSAMLWQGADLNSALLLSSSGEWKGVYHKMRLVPFSEFTPPRARWLERPLGIGRYHFRAGSRTGLMGIPGKGMFGVVICSEEFYPDMFRALAAGSARFAAVMLNDGWFSRREALVMHALAAPLRAVESGLPVIRAANTGLTCAFDGLGRRLGVMPAVGRPATAVYDIPQSRPLTFYAGSGDLFAALCLGFVIISFILYYVKSFSPRRHHAV